LVRTSGSFSKPPFLDEIDLDPSWCVGVFFFTPRDRYLLIEFQFTDSLAVLASSPVFSQAAMPFLVRALSRGFFARASPYGLSPKYSLWQFERVWVPQRCFVPGIGFPPQLHYIAPRRFMFNTPFGVNFSVLRSLCALLVPPFLNAQLSRTWEPTVRRRLPHLTSPPIRRCGSWMSVNPISGDCFGPDLKKPRCWQFFFFP